MKATSAIPSVQQISIISANLVESAISTVEHSTLLESSSTMLVQSSPTNAPPTPAMNLLFLFLLVPVAILFSLVTYCIYKYMKQSKSTNNCRLIDLLPLIVDIIFHIFLFRQMQKEH